ncbi:6-bladed beta-propeller [Candidatus Palauibacter sp.]|uniref:6-bladed beta-propeller n=1 Tax=Candidatus Palauibacter sp. TaxID=3101350 RepID=UPI003B023D6D
MTVRDAILATLAGGGVLAFAGPPSAAAAQEAVSISTEPPACSVALTEALQLGRLDDPGTIGLRPEITRTGDAEFIVASVENRGDLLVYDAEGRFLRTFGGAGQGPGEYRAPGRVRLGTDGSLLILDILNRRITRVSAGGEVLRTVDVRGLQALDFVPAETAEGFFLSGFGGGPDGLTAVTDVVGGEGAAVARLGSEPVDRWVVNFFRAPLAVDDLGRVWAARPGGYRFEAWETQGNGEPVLRLVGAPEWFDPGPPLPGAPITAPAPSVVMSLRFAGGHMWIVTWVADANWRDNADTNPAELQLNRVLDTVLEVIDPASGTLIARTRHAEALRITGDEGLVFGVREDDVVPRAILYTASLEGPGCRSPDRPHM